MRTIFSILIFIQITGLNLYGQHQTYYVCSGNEQVLEIFNFLDGTVFEWFSGDDRLAETSNKIKVSLVTTVPVDKNYHCNLYLNGVQYERFSFRVNFMPNTQVDILAGALCEGRIVSFSMSVPELIAEQTWIIGNDKFYGKTVDLLCGKNPVTVKLQTRNIYGCTSEQVTTFQINPAPSIYILENKLTINFKTGIYCGNSPAEYVLNLAEPQFKLKEWYIQIDEDKNLVVNPQGPKIITNPEIKLIDRIEINGDTMRIKWSRTVGSHPVRITARVSNGNCLYEKTINNILINENSPDVDKLYQKPNASNVLVFPGGQSKGDLNYEWGYTSSTGENKSVGTGRKYYFEYPSLNTSNKYWVETWLNNNEFCRVRNHLLDPVVKNSVNPVGFSFYPNPSSDFVNFKIDPAEDGTIFIRDIYGTLLRKVSVSGNTGQYSLDLSDLKTGTYIVSFVNQSGGVPESDYLIKKQ